MDQINIKKTSLEISNIDSPIFFLLNLIYHQGNISDINFSIILRLFLNFHQNIALNYNLKKLFQNELNNKPLSFNVLNKFYKLTNKKISLMLILKKWYDIYENIKFWNLKISEQLDFLIDMRDQFLSLYDCAKGGVPLHNKIYALLNSESKNIIMKNLEERLFQMLKLVGSKIFISMNIPLISVVEFYSLTNENIIRYLVIIFEKFNDLFLNTIKLFSLYNLACSQLNGLIKPKIITINMSVIDSETEIDDIKLLSAK
jgi:hypothetical protein